MLRPVRPQVVRKLVDGHPVRARTALVRLDSSQRSFQVLSLTNRLHQRVVDHRALGRLRRHHWFGTLTRCRWRRLVVHRREGPRKLFDQGLSRGPQSQRTRCRSPGVSLTAFAAHLPNLQPEPAVDTGLRGFGPARPTQTASLSGSCPSGRGFASALPSDGASRSPPLRLASPLSPPDLGRGLAPPSCQACPAHPAVWNTRTRRSRLNAPPSRRVSHTALDGTKRRPHAPQARSLYSSNTTSRVGLVPRWRNRWEDTDRATSLRSDERSTSPESVFQIPGIGVPLQRNTHSHASASEARSCEPVVTNCRVLAAAADATPLRTASRRQATPAVNREKHDPDAHCQGTHRESHAAHHP